MVYHNIVSFHDREIPMYENLLHNNNNITLINCRAGKEGEGRCLQTITCEVLDGLAIGSRQHAAAQYEPYLCKAKTNFGPHYFSVCFVEKDDKKKTALYSFFFLSFLVTFIVYICIFIIYECLYMHMSVSCMLPHSQRTVGHVVGPISQQ